MSPPTFSENGTLAVPEPRAIPASGARVPKESLHAPGFTVSKRNQEVVSARRGVAAPWRVALVPPTPDASAVATAGDAEVVNDITAPTDVPAPFRATAQK